MQRQVIFHVLFKNKKYDEKDWPLAYASLRSYLRAQELTLTDIQGRQVRVLVLVVIIF